MRIRVLVCVLAVWAVVVASAHAQSPIPGGVELSPGQWVPCSHRLAIDAGLGCLSGSPGVPPSTVPVADDPALVCDPTPDPYAEPERAAACAARALAPDAVPSFRLGHVYAYGYDSVRARIVSLGTDVDGVQVVTVRWLDGGELSAVRTPPTPGGATVWRLVGVAR